MGCVLQQPREGNLQLEAPASQSRGQVGWIASGSEFQNFAALMRDQPGCPFSQPSAVQIRRSAPADKWRKTADTVEKLEKLVL
jgi:hypothetical protein